MNSNDSNDGNHCDPCVVESSGWILVAQKWWFLVGDVGGYGIMDANDQWIQHPLQKILRSDFPRTEKAAIFPIPGDDGP